MERLIRAITTIDEGGHEVLVEEFRELIKIETNAAREWIGGRAWLQLVSGEEVTIVDEHTFRLASTGGQLKVIPADLKRNS